MMVNSRSLKIGGSTFLAALSITLAIPACGGSKPDVAACKAAMARQLASGIANPDQPAGTRPKACTGVDDKTLNRLAAEILAREFG